MHHPKHYNIVFAHKTSCICNTEQLEEMGIQGCKLGTDNFLSERAHSQFTEKFDYW